MAHAHSHEHEHEHSHGHAHSHDPEPPSAADSFDEAAHQAQVQATFDLYRRAALSSNQRRRADFYALPKRHRDLLPDYNSFLREVCPVSLLISALI